MTVVSDGRLIRSGGKAGRVLLAGPVAAGAPARRICDVRDLCDGSGGILP